ncbi:DUF4157 domain-containing protein [Streptomyces sp. NPDC001339]|uniref:eCIS core domain-containing protein n=1 Tax=Streptomyces sp. NPDC001339 TaxID=3364563 RepID=UPI0036903C0F
MSTSQAAQDTRSAAHDKRRKRRERAAKSRAPEPKDIVSGAGQPLDLSVRRELEERLGHDFSQVRLHTDRGSGQLAEMMGADAFAVGQDIFFREGTYRPGTADGRRLLAHELLHTVQNPHGLGALRAGRDLGSVSLPQESVEREAESAARASVRDALQGATREEDPAAGVEPGRATPGWLRYATAGADRSRIEQLDPATLVDRLANGVLRSLRGDPEDLSGRVRGELARMGPELQESVLDRLEVRLLASEFDRVLDLTAEAEAAAPLALQPSNVPEPVPDALAPLQDERSAAAGQREGRKESREARDEDAAEEKQNTKGRDGEREQDRSRAEQDAAAEKKEAGERTAQEDERAQELADSRKEQQRDEEKQGQEREKADQADAEKAEKGQEGAERTKEERKEQREREERDPEQANRPGADKRKRQDDAAKPADGAKPEEVDPRARKQPGPVRPEKVDERGEQRDSALSAHGLHEKDEDEGEPREEERPLGLEAGADKEVDGGQEEKRGGGGGKGEAELKPEDHLPETDPDLSSVPTAENPSAAMPSFPAPPPTKAERIQQERENDTGQEEDEEAPEAEAKAPGEERGPVEGEAPQPEHGPAADAPDRSEKDLAPEKPVEQEVGPDPENEEKPEPEQEAEEKSPEQQQDQDEDGAKAARQDAGDRTADADGDSGDGQEKPDAAEAQDEQDEKKEQERHEEKAEARGRPEGAAAEKPASAAAGGGPGAGATAAPAAASRPAGAPKEQTRAEDRHPSPAARRTAQPDRAERTEREAAAPRSQIPKESGPGAAPSGSVGTSEPAGGPKAAEGPGGAPSAAKAAVGPAGEQADSPGKLGAPAPEGAKANPEASLEKDGGGCAPPEPSGEQDAGGKVGCGGSGGAAAPEREKKPEPPDVSGQDPKAALSTVGKLPPDQAQQALPGVDGAAEKKVADEQRRLDANPPKRERPSGAPQTQSAPPPPAPAAAPVTGKLERAGEEQDKGEQKAKGGEKAEGAKATENVRKPELPPSKDGKITAGDADSVAEAADRVPTTDPELRNKTVGPAPKIKLEGKSDPKRTDEQADALKKKQGKIQETGREDASKPLGEDKIFPNAPKEQLAGKAAGGRRRGGGGRERPSAAPKEGIGVVAQQEKGAELRGGANDAQGQLTAKEKEHQQGEQKSKQEKQAEIDKEVAANADQQTAERGRAAEEATKERQNWRDEQDKKIEEADKETEKEHKDKNGKITKGRDDKDKEVSDRKDTDNKDIDKKREDAEKEAEKKKEDEKKKSDSLLGKLIGAISDFFDNLVKLVSDVFDKARGLINGVIDKFKEFADKAIDFVRDLAIDLINKLADALIAVCDVLLAAFPELRDKFRNKINELRDAAINTVNRLADGLKKAVNTLLDALAAGLNALLDVLEAGIKAAINVYKAVIVGALKFAQAAIDAMGKFAELLADIAPDPGGWLGKAGSAAKAGIQDHLWDAIKTGVKRWFDTKVEGILGLGKAVINVLVKGCMSIKQIGKMAWDAIIASLPMMIASLVIEKLISSLMPAAGAILTILQGLLAAWRSISSIIAAFGKFWAYLKAVKAGPAACLFAEAVAAGIVALLDFISNFLLIRLERATKGVGKRLKAMAQKIMQGLKKTGKGARKAAGKAVNAAKGAVRKAAQALRKPVRPAKPRGPRVPDRPGHSTDRNPGGGPPAHQPKTHPDGRPTSRTPDPLKKRREDEADVKKAKDESGPDRTPAQDGPGKAPAKDGPDLKKSKGPDKDAPDAKKSKTPAKPPKKKEVEAPKRPKKQRPKSPLGRALKKLRGTIKAALKKTRNAVKTLGRKLTKSKLGKSIKNTGKKLYDKFKKKRHDWRDEKNRRTRHKKQRKDDKKKKENTRESKSKRLDKAVDRIRAILKKLLRPGLPQAIHRGTLAVLRRWYRLTTLEKRGNRERFEDHATLNPPDKVIGGFSDPKDRTDYLEEQQLPDPKIPPRKEDALPPTAAAYMKGVPNIGNKKTKGEYLSRAAKHTGEKPNVAGAGQPLGWQYITHKNMSRMKGESWVRMHLLPEALGGKAGGDNLVPARSQQTNLTFYREIEGNAYEDVPDPYKMIWYEAEAKFGYDDFPGFPSHINARYGTYTKKKGTGRSPRDWREDPGAKDSYAQTKIPKPDPSEHNKLPINSAGPSQIRNFLGPETLEEREARYLAGVTGDGARYTKDADGNRIPIPRTVFRGPADVRKFLTDKRNESRGNRTLPNLERIMAKINERKKEINWGNPFENSR